MLAAFNPQLPRPVWLLQVGGVMNSFGNGVVLPFLVIYLHTVRGFGLGVSGLVVAASAARRHAAYAQQRVTMNLGIGLGGLVGGAIATVHHPHSFTILFLADAATFLVYVAVLAFVPDPGVGGEAHAAKPSSYRAVLRD